MTVYLVDMENIPHAWGRLLDICGEDDRFVLFYTEQVTQVPITLMVKALESQAAMEYIRCHSGPNGLDFQLVTEMGWRIARDPSAEYVIVSQDHGYDVVIEYWSERGVRTKRAVPTAVGQGGVFSEYSARGGAGVQIPEFTSEQELKEFLSWKLLNRVPKGEIPFIAEALMEALGQGAGYSTDRRLSCRFTYLDRALRERYGNVKGPKIRDQIKAVSREVFGIDMNTPDQPEEAAEEPDEAAAEPAALEPAAEEPIAEESAVEKPAKEETETPAAEPAAEETDAVVYAPFSALPLPAGRAEELSAIVSEVLERGEAHPKAAVYRKILSAYGRVEGGELYRAVKEAVEQILSERKE